MLTSLLLSMIVLLLLYIYRTRRHFITTIKKLENELVIECGVKDIAINIAKVTLEERKKCELCRKDYII